MSVWLRSGEGFATVFSSRLSKLRYQCPAIQTGSHGSSEEGLGSQVWARLQHLLPFWDVRQNASRGEPITADLLLESDRAGEGSADCRRTSVSVAEEPVASKWALGSSCRWKD